MRVQAHARTRVHAPGLQAQEAHLRGHRQVGHGQGDAGTGRQVVNGQGKLTTTQGQNQVKTSADVHLHHAGSRGAQADRAALAQTQIDRRLQAHQFAIEANWQTQITANSVVADLLRAKQSRSIDRCDELIHRLDLLDLLVHAVAHRLEAFGKIVRHTQARTIRGHVDDLRGHSACLPLGVLSRHRHPETGHGRSKLPRSGLEGCIPLQNRESGGAGFGRLTATSLPRFDLAVEVDLVNHLRLEDRGHIQQITQRLLNERQTRQTKFVHIDGLQVAQHVGQCGNQVRHADLVELGQLVQVLGLDIELSGKRADGDRDRRGRVWIGGQVNARQTRVNGQCHIKAVLVRWRVHSQLAFDELQITRHLRAQTAALPRLARHTIDGGVIHPANAQAQRAQTGVQDHILCRQIARKTQLAQIQIGAEAIFPIQLEIKVQRRLKAGIDLHHAINAHAHLAQRTFQVQVQAFDLVAHVTGEAQGQPLLIEVETQTLRAIARLPVGFQVSLQPTQGRHALGAKGRCILAQVIQHMLAQAQLIGNLQQIVQRLTDQRQVLIGQQIRIGPVHLLGQTGQSIPQHALQRSIEVGDGELGHIRSTGKAHLHIVCAHGDGLVHGLARGVHGQAHIAHQGRAPQARNRQTQAGLQIERITLTWQHHTQLAIHHASRLTGHIHRGFERRGSDQHRARARLRQAHIGAARNQSGRIGCCIRGTQLQQHRAFGLNLRRLAAQRSHGRTIQDQRRHAIGHTIAIQVTQTEVHHTAVQCTCTWPHVDIDRHARTLEGQAWHAFQAGAGCTGLQAHKAAAPVRVLQQRQAHAGVLQRHAHKVVRASPLAQLHIHVLRGDQGGAQTAAAAVVQRRPAQAQRSQAKGATHTDHVADVQRRIQRQAHELTGRIAKVQRCRAAATCAHLQAAVHQGVARACAAQVHHLAVGDAALVAHGLVHLKSQLSGLDVQQVIRQAQCGRIELDLLHTGFDRHPAARIAGCGIGGAQQGQSQGRVIHLNALHLSRHARGAQIEACDRLGASAHAHVHLLTRQHHRARCSQHIAQSQRHAAFHLKDLPLQVQRHGARRGGGLDRDRCLAPIHRAGVGLALGGLAQAHVELQAQVPARQAQAHGLRAQHAQGIGLSLEREPSAAIGRIGGRGQGHAQIQPRQFQPNGRRIGACGHTRVDVRAADDHHPALHRLGHATCLLLAHAGRGLQPLGCSARFAGGDHLQIWQVFARQGTTKADVQVVARRLRQEQAGRSRQAHAQIKRTGFTTGHGREVDEGALHLGTGQSAFCIRQGLCQFLGHVVGHLVSRSQTTPAIAKHTEVFGHQGVNHVLIGHTGQHHLVAHSVITAEQQQLALRHTGA